MKYILIILITLFSLNCFGCSEPGESYTAYYKDWKRTKPNTFYIYVPRTKEEFILRSVEIGIQNSGVPVIAVYADIHDPSGYEEDAWYKQYMAAIIKIDRKRLNDLIVKATYSPKDEGVIVKCDNSISFTFKNMYEKL